MAQNTRNNVLIVGGSSGVGLATAKLALTHLPGTAVIISSSNKDKLEKAIEEIKASSPSKDTIIDYIVGDVSKLDSQHEDVEKILEAAVKCFQGKIDHIVWTAGSFPSSPPGDKPSHDRAIQAATTRVFGPLTLCHLAKKYMNESRRSSITISSGVLIHKPKAGMGGILGGAAMEEAARGLAADLAPIRANSILLGPIQTPLLDGTTGGNEEAKKAYANGTVLKEIGGADEAAEAYLFSMRCAYITGSRIDCDGGAMMV